MKLFLAGEREMFARDGTIAIVWREAYGGVEEFQRRIRRRLFSYYYHGFKEGNRVSDEMTGCHKNGLDMFLDSGAFTAFTKGIEIPLKRYADFIKKHGNSFEIVSNLDVIGDTGPESWSNLKELEKETGQYITPVFHANDEMKWLSKMVLNDNYHTIALGGMVGAHTNVLQTWLDHVWSNYLTNRDGTAICKVHGFGLTDQKLMFRYPWYSVDSSSWLMTGIFGSCVFLTPAGKIYKVLFSNESRDIRKWNGWHYLHLPQDMKTEIDTMLKGYGVSGEQCAVHFSFRDCVNASVFQEFEALGTDAFHAEQRVLF